MKRFAVIQFITVAVLYFTPVKAQDYKFGIGLRLGGYSTGINFKGFVNPKGAVEGIAGFGSHSFVTTVLYEHHIPIPKVEGLKLYVGGGGHAGIFGHDSSHRFYRHGHETVYVVDEGSTAFIPGADFIFGAEYKFKDVPFTVGTDIKPFMDFYDGVSGYFDGAINLRYVF